MPCHFEELGDEKSSELKRDKISRFARNDKARSSKLKETPLALTIENVQDLKSSFFGRFRSKGYRCSLANLEFSLS
jgi:hypothetical protein